VLQTWFDFEIGGTVKLEDEEEEEENGGSDNIITGTNEKVKSD
jgi:hypothetical protein